MKTRCLILDDEPLARDVIFNYAEKFEDLQVVAQCSDAEEARQMLLQLPVDLIFLDIHLPKTSGLEFLKSLQYPPKIIVTTAYREYAMEGFELDVVDYLLKPIKLERFMRAVNKYQQIVGVIQADFNGGKPFIFVREHKKEVKISLCDIQYIEGLGEYVRIHTSRKKVITKRGMSQMEEKLPRQFFLRIHKSYMVCLLHVEAYTNTSVELAGVELPIGRRYKSSVMNLLTLAEGVSGL